MPLGPYREADIKKLEVARVIEPQRGGKQLRLRVGNKELLVELSVSDVEELGDVKAGDWVETIFHSLVEHAEPGVPNRYEVEAGWASGRIEGRVDQLVGGRWSGLVFDMGGGLKSYVDMEMDSGFDPSKVGTGEWWRFNFSLPHQCIMIRKAS
ncbi:MAG: hypothetical protein HYU36_03585 [Planctomycetes bacterium]|nr:hypothetical protein [Planctomycetota bacterium]